MSIKLKKLMSIGIIAFLIGLVGCKNNVEVEHSDYLRCNKTSNGSMAETKEGYFFASNEILYYADKNNLEQWVAVCNKPDCVHMDDTCNGYLPSYNTIWQKDGKLYEIAYGDLLQTVYIYEIAADGSGLKRAYEIPIEGDIKPSKYSKATFQDVFLLNYCYLNEDGEYQDYIIRLEEDESGEVNIDRLHEGIGESTSSILTANGYWSIRGDNLIITNLYLEEGSMVFNNLCRIDGEKIEPLNLPDDISIYGAYLNNDIFTYYNVNEGFYHYNTSTGEKALLFENQLEDGHGYILSEDCMVECNRYVGYMPEEAYLKVYNGEEWIDVKLLKELTNSDDPFYPVCITSDRIFFRKSVAGDDNTVTIYLYYMMLEEKNPELVFAGKIGNAIEEESSVEEETEKENIFTNFEEVVVFDTEEYLFKITDVYLDYADRCCIEMYFENRSDDKKYGIIGEHGAINGIHCEVDWGTGGGIPNNETATYTLCLINDMVDTSKVSEFYNSNEYTDIEIEFNIYDDSNQKRILIEEKYVHIYPQGEENAITFTREHQSTDQVLVDNENVSVIITGYEEYFVSGDTINVLIENKTDKLIKVKVEEASANGIAIEANNYFGAYYVYVNPGAVAMYPMTLFDGRTDGPFCPEPNNTFFVKNNITNIEKIEMKLRISEYFTFVGDGEDLVYEIFVLNP